MIAVHAKRKIEKHALLIQDLRNAGFKLPEEAAFVDMLGMGVWIEDDENPRAVKAFIDSWAEPPPVIEFERLKTYMKEFNAWDIVVAVVKWYEGDPSEMIKLKSIVDRIEALYPDL